MGEPFFTQTVSGKWQIGWIKMSSRLTLLFCHITAAAGILRHSWGHTDMHAQAQAHAQAAQSWWHPSRRCLPSPPVASEPAAASAEGPLPGCLLQDLFLFAFLLSFLCLFPFSSVSQRTWALSFSTPEPGVRFYNVDPLQKARSICLIS